MKIGIMTKIGKNYGAVLQAFATKYTLERKGVDAAIINYMHRQSQKTYSTFKYKWGPRGAIGNLKALKHYSAIKVSSKKFESFKKNHLNLLGNYTNYSQLQASPPECQVYISGSDQVWNPTISFDPAYYLKFGNENIKRASYAASIGISSIPKEIEDEFISRISTFDLISVREETAQKLLSNYRIYSRTSLDPTLLLESKDWDKIAKVPSMKRPYILCYMVSTPNYAQKLVNHISSLTGMPVVNIMTSSFSEPFGDYQIWDAGPEEFIGYFKNAEKVITSSFHGTVFSILYNKPFVSMLYSATGSRVRDLLSNLELSNRIVESFDEFQESLLEINYDEAKLKLLKLKEESLNIIDEIITLPNESN
jgi:hypothetical protein